MTIQLKKRIPNPQDGRVAVALDRHAARANDFPKPAPGTVRGALPQDGRRASWSRIDGRDTSAMRLSGPNENWSTHESTHRSSSRENVLRAHVPGQTSQQQASLDAVDVLPKIALGGPSAQAREPARPATPRRWPRS